MTLITIRKVAKATAYLLTAISTVVGTMARGRVARKVPRRTNSRTPPRPRRCAALGSRPPNPCRALKSGVACAISPGNPLPSPGAAHRRRQHRLQRAPAVSGLGPPRNAFSGNRMTPLGTLTDNRRGRGVLDLDLVQVMQGS